MEKVIICRCEEVTKEELIDAINKGAKSIDSLKRKTECGMGLCQGRSCEKLVARILSEETGLSPEDVTPMTRRPPLRPVPLEVLGGEIK